MIKLDHKKELSCDSLPKERGDYDDDCGRVQEWVNLQKHHIQGFNVTIAVDDDFGGGTQAAIRHFQEHFKLSVTGEVNEETWQQLIAPMKRAFGKITFSGGETIQERVVRYAKQQLIEHPVELYSNKGPWVRSYCFGMDGSAYAWCAGFVTSIVDLAADTQDKNVKNYMKASLSCDRILSDAMEGNRGQTHHRNLLVKTTPELVEVGDLFLVINRKNPLDAKHIGIVTDMNGTIMTTIEGNTNDEGSRDGYEVCQRYRDLAKGSYDIVKLS